MTRAKASDLSERELLESHAKALEAQVEGLRVEVEKMRAALTDIRDLPLMTLTIARSRATYALRGADESQPGEGDNRAVSTERRRNAAAVSGTPESYSRSDPRQDARTPAGDGVASPVLHADEATQTQSLLDARAEVERLRSECEILATQRNSQVCEIDRLRAREAELLAQIEKLGAHVDEAADKVKQRL